MKFIKNSNHKKEFQLPLHVYSLIFQFSSIIIIRTIIIVLYLLFIFTIVFSC